MNPDADQIAADIVGLRRPVERLAGEKLVGDLTVAALFGFGGVASSAMGGAHLLG
jgi:hypothetical protein